MSVDLTRLVEEKVQKHAAAAIALSDDLAAHPEISDEEFESSRKMAEMLTAAGFEVEYPFCGYPTAFSAVLDNGDGPSIAVMAEYDALPDIGHACGHNVHGAMSVLAGLALRELKDVFKGKVYVIGTPAEEMDGAKIGMAERGVFDRMDLAVMIHSNAEGLSHSTMALLALKGYDFVFKGQTAHAAASPWGGRNALVAARKFLDLVDARRQGFMTDVRFNGIFLDGGRAPNIIPERAEVRTEIRAESSARVESMMEAVLNCARGAALALDCEVEWKPYLSDFADMVRNKPAEDAMQRIFEGLGVEVSPVLPPSGSSDVGNVSYRCPSIQPLLAITRESYNLHTIEFARTTLLPEAHKALVLGARALALLALEVMNDSGLRDAIRADFIREKEAKSKT